MMKKIVVTVVLIFSLFFELKSQDSLPNFRLQKVGNKALLNWKNNSFSNISMLLIQRSYDSIKGFSTVAEILNPNNKENGFLDNRTPLSTKVFYRIFISFPGGNYLFSKSKRLEAKSLVSLDSAGTVEAEELDLGTVKSNSVKFIMQNNLQITFPNPQKKYGIKFFSANLKPIFEIKQLPESDVVIDKSNFVSGGTYFFELYEDGKLLERGKIFIPNTLGKKQ